MSTPLDVVDYSSSVTPPAYRCDACDACGVKLWRQWNTIASAISLRCATCALKAAGVPGPVGDDGRLPSRFGPRTDQIGNMAPAVPTADGETFWGYTSVPEDAVAWWQRLPTMPRGQQTPDAVVATLTAQVDALRKALVGVALREKDDGPCFCAIVAGPHHMRCVYARGVLEDTQQGGK